MTGMTVAMEQVFSVGYTVQPPDPPILRSHDKRVINTLLHLDKQANENTNLESTLIIYFSSLSSLPEKPEETKEIQESWLILCTYSRLPFDFY